jgi:hypothetical protein
MYHMPYAEAHPESAKEFWKDVRHQKELLPEEKLNANWGLPGLSALQDKRGCAEVLETSRISWRIIRSRALCTRNWALE